jgi:hypothetical protein
MTDLGAAFAAFAAGAAGAAAPVPRVTPLAKAELKKALHPVVGEYLAGVRVKLANLLERIEWIEERRADEIARLGGGHA